MIKVQILSSCLDLAEKGEIETSSLAAAVGKPDASLPGVMTTPPAAHAGAALSPLKGTVSNNTLNSQNLSIHDSSVKVERKDFINCSTIYYY